MPTIYHLCLTRFTYRRALVLCRGMFAVFTAKEMPANKISSDKTLGLRYNTLKLLHSSVVSPNGLFNESFSTDALHADMNNQKHADTCARKLSVFLSSPPLCGRTLRRVGVFCENSRFACVCLRVSHSGACVCLRVLFLHL